MGKAIGAAMVTPFAARAETTLATLLDTQSAICLFCVTPDLHRVLKSKPARTIGLIVAGNVFVYAQKL